MRIAISWLLTAQVTLCLTATRFTRSKGGDDVIFISAGYGGETSTEVLDAGEGECSRITTQLPGSTPWISSMDLLHSNIIICGGVGTDTSCIAAESPSGPWSSHSVTTRSRYGHSSAVAGGTLHLLGGNGNEGSVESLVGATWREGPPPPYEIGGGSCSVTVGGNKIIVMGGYGSMRRVAQWDVGTNEWTELPSLNVGRWWHGCALIDNHTIVVAGGYSEDGDIVISEDFDVTKDSEVYNTNGNTWVVIGDMNQVRVGLVMINVNSRVLAMGGYDQDGNVLDSVEELTGSQHNDFTWKTTNIKLKEKRYGFAALAVKRSKFC